MAEFLADLQQHTFLQYAVITGILAAVPCGVIGTYVVTRRITYIAGAIAHSVLGGLGAARFCQVVCGWSWLDPLYGALVAAVVSAVIIGLVSLYAHQREDTVIGAVWAIGMAVGILFIFKTPGYNEDLMSYLFGNILMVSPGDLRLIVGLDIVVLVFSVLFYNQLLAVCFDEEFARVRGIRVEFYYLLLLCLTSLTVVLLVTVVGVVMVIALLTLPVAVASHFANRLWLTMILSAALTILFTLSGLALSYTPDLPAGATTIVLAGGVYLAVAAASALWGRKG
ncbi:MAG: metal ABC transporter permease [Desulfobacteraceae bacterium]